MASPERIADVRFVKSFDGARIEYEIEGDGPPLAMLHGQLSSRRTFSRQCAVLAERFRLILVSLRGHDGSDVVIPPNYGVGSSDVDDLRVILDAEQVDRFSLLGHSSGGAAAFVFACQSPERVARLIRDCPEFGGIRLPPPVEALDGGEDQTNGRTRSRACRCRPRSGPGGAGQHHAGTNAFVVTCSSAG